MNQTLAIQEVIEKIDDAVKREDYKDPDAALALLQSIKADLHCFHEAGIDFKVVVDSLDDSIYITDREGRVMYVNPAHKKNTNIEPEEVLGRLTSDIVREGTLFTGGSTLDVIKEKKKIFRLSTVQKKDPPEVGYTVGVPIFDRNGELTQVVVSSRPILSLQALHEDYGRFLSEIDRTKDQQHVTIHKNAKSPSMSADRLIGASYSLKKISDIIALAAPTDATVLITGESGVGKEVIADEIYRRSDRSDRTFIKVNCASIPANLLESELFGYERGAFSGANSGGKPGLFEMASGGTLLLDEIGDMPMDLQVKLLRAIQDKKITRVGGTKPIQLDIRFIAATNSDLKKKIAEGTFRQDLFYRLNVIPVNIPPLRERINDIDALTDHFIDVFAEKHHRRLTLSEKNREIFRAYHWPGNVRELENVIEYLTICASGSDHVDEETLRGILDISQSDNPATGTGTLAQSVENYEKNLIETVLKNAKSLRDAGARLGVNASTISRKIKQYGIDYPGTK